jgi:hypothetical protein
MTKHAGSLVAGVAVAATAAVATIISAPAGADGLPGLDAKLQGTGRVGTPPAQAPGHLAASSPDAGAPERTRDPRQAVVRIEDDSAAAAAATPPRRPDAADTEELHHTDAAVAACRIEVARRRRLPPSKVAAGSVVLRFTIERTGRVREAEALSAIDTDPEVAACAKRVLSDWTFRKRVRDAAVVVERTYRFSRS